MTDTRSQILEAAERMVRTGGYNGFSFRQVATEIGIKSASVHHHFPTKEDLALAVAENYASQFLAMLGEPAPEGGSVRKQLEKYCAAFQNAFEESGRACLCGILSNESPQLPESVRKSVIAFVEANLAWLEKAMSFGKRPNKDTRQKAQMIYSTLEGTMGVATLTQDVSWIKNASRSILKSVID